MPWSELRGEILERENCGEYRGRYFPRFFGEMVIDGINLWILLLLSDIIIVRRTKQVLHDDFTIRRNT